MVDTEERLVAGLAFGDTAFDLGVTQARGGIIGVEGLLADPGDVAGGAGGAGGLRCGHTHRGGGDGG